MSPNEVQQNDSNPGFAASACNLWGLALKKKNGWLLPALDLAIKDTEDVGFSTSRLV